MSTVLASVTEILRRANEAKASELAARSREIAGPGELPLSASSIKMMRATGWRPRSLANLVLLERVLDAIDPPGQSPEPGGHGCTDGAGGQPHDGAAAAQGDDVPPGAADGSHDRDINPANAVRRLEKSGGVQTCADPAEAGSRRASHPARSVPANGPDGHSPLRPGDAGPGDQPARSVR